MKLFSTVRVREDMPELGLRRGATGTIIEIFDSPTRAFEVEFTDAQGRTIVQTTLLEDQLEDMSS
jgi:hypothetical protein